MRDPKAKAANIEYVNRRVKEGAIREELKPLHAERNAMSARIAEIDKEMREP